MQVLIYTKLMFEVNVNGVRQEYNDGVTMIGKQILLLPQVRWTEGNTAVDQFINV